MACAAPSAGGLSAGFGAGVAGVAGGGAAGAAPCVPTAAKTSGRLTTPPRPVPATDARSTPDSSARRRAEGALRTVAAGTGAATGATAAGRCGWACGAADGTGAGRGAAATSGAAATGAAVAPTAASSNSPSRSLTPTTSPSARARDASTPALSAGTSTVILSVSSSTSVSPAATGSPSRFSHRETVASVMDSPSGGTLIETMHEHNRVASYCSSTESRPGSCGR